MSNCFQKPLSAFWMQIWGQEGSLQGQAACPGEGGELRLGGPLHHVGGNENSAGRLQRGELLDPTMQDDALHQLQA